MNSPSRQKNYYPHCAIVVDTLFVFEQPKSLVTPQRPASTRADVAEGVTNEQSVSEMRPAVQAKNSSKRFRHAMMPFSAGNEASHLAVNGSSQGCVRERSIQFRLTGW
jgi:hypothetical protein